MGQAVEFVIKGNPAAARDLAATILTSAGFNLDWVDEWGANAVSGTATANTLGDDFGTGFQVGMRVTLHTEGSKVRFDRMGSSFLGGFRGGAKMAKNMQALGERFAGAARAEGFLFTALEG